MQGVQEEEVLQEVGILAGDCTFEEGQGDVFCLLLQMPRQEGLARSAYICALTICPGGLQSRILGATLQQHDALVGRHGDYGAV